MQLLGVERLRSLSGVVLICGSGLVTFRLHVDGDRG